MSSKGNYKERQSVQFLFTMLLLFLLAISALFTILFGARIYENIGNRMEENFGSVTSLSYISNKVRQGDRAGQISVVDIEGVQVLKISEVYGQSRYDTMIYCKDGMLKELFSSADSGLTLDDGMDIMELESVSFEMTEDDVLKITNSNGEGQPGNSLVLSMRSGGQAHE